MFINRCAICEHEEVVAVSNNFRVYDLIKDEESLRKVGSRLRELSFLLRKFVKSCYKFVTVLDKIMKFHYNSINTCYGTSG